MAEKTYHVAEAQYNGFLKGKGYRAFHFEETGGKSEIFDYDGNKVGTATKNPLTEKITITTGDETAQRYLENVLKVKGEPAKTIEERTKVDAENFVNSLTPEQRDTFRKLSDLSPNERMDEADLLMKKVFGKGSYDYVLSESQYDQFLKDNGYDAFHFEETGGKSKIFDKNGNKIGTATKNLFSGKITVTINTENERARNYLEDNLHITGTPTVPIEERSKVDAENFVNSLTPGQIESFRKLSEMGPAERHEAINEVSKIVGKGVQRGKKQKT